MARTCIWYQRSSDSLKCSKTRVSPLGSPWGVSRTCQHWPYRPCRMQVGAWLAGRRHLSRTGAVLSSSSLIVHYAPDCHDCLQQQQGPIAVRQSLLVLQRSWNHDANYAIIMSCSCVLQLASIPLLIVQCAVGCVCGCRAAQVW